MRFKTEAEALAFVKQHYENNPEVEIQFKDVYVLYHNYVAKYRGVVVADFGWNFMTGRFDGDFFPLPDIPAQA